MEEKIKNLKKENVKKIEEVELQPTWSKLKSFHGKAMTGTNEKGNKYLKSFGFLVAEIIEGKVKIHNEVDKWDSKSTIRHINNFLYENGFETGNSKEITEMYITKTKKIEKTEDKSKNEKSKDKKIKEPKALKEEPLKELKNEKNENCVTEKIIEVVGA